MDVERIESGYRFCSSDEWHCYYVDLSPDEAIAHLRAVAEALGYTVSKTRSVGDTDQITATADGQHA